MKGLAAFVALWIAAAAGDARQAPAQPPRFRSGVEVVELDVSAIDKEGRPVRGLTAADFTVLEDGQPQSIVQFAAVDIPDPPPAPTAWVRDVVPEVQDNIVADRRLFVILLDDARSPANPLIVKSTKAMARSLVNQLGPSDLAAVVFTSHNSHAQDFTSDRPRLLAAIDTFTPDGGLSRPAFASGGGGGGGGARAAPALPSVNMDSSFESTISALRQIADLILRVYQHVKGPLESVQLEIRVVDDHDAVKFHAAETIAADRFDASRAVDHRFNLPLADLSPGPHLLTIEAAAGRTTARRDVRFVVR